MRIGVRVRVRIRRLRIRVGVRIRIAPFGFTSVLVMSDRTSSVSTGMVVDWTEVVTFVFVKGGLVI